MFSAIFEFFEKMEELKLKKQKKETKKEIKKQEKKLEEEKKDIVEVKDKAKKHKKVVESKEKENKSKIKIWVLRVLKWISTIIEQFILWLITLIGWVGVLVILIVLVLMIVIYGLLHIDFTVSDGKLFKGETVESDCISTGEILSGSSWSELDISSVSGTLTPYQMNLYKLFSLYDEFMKGDGTNTPLLKDMSHDVSFRVYRGICATETGFYLFGPSDTTHDILKDFTPTGSGTYIGPFQMDYRFSIDTEELHRSNLWDGSAFLNTWKSKYQKPGSEKDHYWMPYAVGMSVMMISSNGSYAGMNTNSSGYTEFKDFTYQRMEHFGIEANKEECFQYIRGFLSVASYLNGLGVTGLNYNTSNNISEKAGGKARIDFFCALFAASSDDDSKRSFNNYSIILNDETKLQYAEGEGSLREWLIGSQGYSNYTGDLGSIVIGNNKNPRISVSGKELNVPVMRYVYEKYKDDPEMTQCWNHIKGSTGQFLSSYFYGFASLLQGNHIEAELGGSLPLASGGNIDECDCYDGPNGGSVGAVDIQNITEGEVQGPWSSSTKSHLESMDDSVKKFYGQVYAIKHPDHKMSSLGITVEEWREKSKFGVPAYWQYGTGTESAPNCTYLNNKLSSLAFDKTGTSRLAGQGCHIYMQSFMASCLTGKVINPTEMAIAGLHLDSIASGGICSMINTYKMFNDLGLKAVSVKGGDVQGDVADCAAYFGVEESAFKTGDKAKLKELFDKVLEKNGVIGTAAGSPYTTGTNHYVVVHNKVGENYQVFGYNIGTGAYNGQNTDDYSWDTVYKGIYTNAASGYRGQMVFAYNPNLGGTLKANNGAYEDPNFLFIGDSFTVGLKDSVGLETKGHTVIAESSTNPSDWLKDEKIALLPAEIDIDNVVVLLGVNGVMNSNQITDMKAYLDKLIELYPSKIIYVQKVFPVASTYTSYSYTDMNTAIENYNKEIKDYCGTKAELQFIDTTAGLVGDDGTLNDADSQGLHIGSAEGYQKWWTNISSVLLLEQQKDATLVKCNPKGSGQVSANGALDLDMDIINVVDDCKPGWTTNTDGDMSGNPEVIVVHYWGNEGGMNRSYSTGLLSGIKSGSNRYFAHYYVDYDNIYQVAPLNKIIWHAGGLANKTNGKGTLSFFAGNSNGIGIEVSNVQRSKNDFAFEKTVLEKAISLTKALMIEYNIDVDHVVRHWDCNLKPCPAPFVDKKYGSPYGATTGWDNGESQYWKAFKNALTSDTIDWASFGDSVVEDLK